MHIRQACLAGLASIVLLGSAQAAVFVQLPAVYAADSDTPDKVKEECQLDNFLPGLLLANLGKLDPATQPYAEGVDVGSNYLLKLTITKVIANPGGPITGSKSMTVRADLVQNGVVMASTVKTRSTGRGGIFGQVFRGTCSLLEKDASVIAKDLTRWIKPTLTASTLPASDPATAASAEAEESK